MPRQTRLYLPFKSLTRRALGQMTLSIELVACVPVGVCFSRYIWVHQKRSKSLVIFTFYSFIILKPLPNEHCKMFVFNITIAFL